PAHPLLPPGEVFIDNRRVQVVEGRAGHGLAFEVAGALRCGKLADLLAAQGAVLGPLADEHAPILERVQLRAALDRDRDDLAGLQLDLVPADGDRRPDLALS